jgi:fatty-acyl-CoA synthase
VTAAAGDLAAAPGVPALPALSGVPALPALSPVRAIALQSRYRPGKVAIDDGEPVTYAELWSRTRGAAEQLTAAGATPGSAVALALPPSADHMALILGAMLAGAVAVPVNTRLRPAEVERFLAPIAPSVTVASDEHRDLLEVVEGSPTRRGGAGLDGFGGLRARRTRHGPHPDLAAGGLLVGTGGTTGIPKAAHFDHERLWLWTAASAANNRVRAADVELFVSPFFHGTLVTGVLTSLTQGAGVVVLDRFDAERAVEHVAAGRITRLLGAATVVDRLMRAARGRDLSGSRLRFVQFGMSSTRSGFARDIAEAFPGTQVITGYGATEYGPVTRAYGEDFDAQGDPVGVGRPVPGADIVIEAGGELHATGSPDGEILVTAPWQMLGYCSADEELRDAVARDGRIRSGDVGRFDAAGNLHVTGRLKEAIRSGGENVYPAEVEQALHRHGSVAACAVYGVPDAEWGERVEAAVVPGDGGLDLGGLEAHARTLIAGYKVPKRFVVLDALPLTSANKVDRRALRAAAAGRP